MASSLPGMQPVSPDEKPSLHPQSWLAVLQYDMIVVFDNILYLAFSQSTVDLNVGPQVLHENEICHSKVIAYIAAAQSVQHDRDIYCRLCSLCKWQ